MTQLLAGWFGPAMLFAGALLLLFAGACDFAARRVPNRVPAMLAAVGIVLRVHSGDLIAASATAFIVLMLAFLCWQRGWLGGGDVKLLAAAALLVAPVRVPALILAVALAGGALAAVYLLLRAVLPDPRSRLATELPVRNGSRVTRVVRVLRVEQWRIRRRASLPYASAIFAGVVFVLLSP